MTGDATAEEGGALPGGFRAWAAGACAVHVVAGLALWEPTLFPGGDNAGYMILGEALRTGAGYVDLHLPDAPVHTRYPPLYPTLLAVLGWVGGLQLFKAASLALTTGAVALTAGLGRRWGGPLVGATAGALAALSPVLLDYSHYVLSEALFVFLVLAALWAAARTGGGPASLREGGDGSPGPSTAGEGGTSEVRWFALALAAGAAAFLTRTAGLPLLAALVVLPALRRQGRRTAAAAATAAVVAGGWALAQRLGAPDQAGYLQQLLMVDPYDPAAGTVDAAGLVRRTAENFWRYVVEVLPSSVAGTRGTTGALAGAAGIVVAGLAAAGWIRRSLREIGPAELFLFLYLGTVSAWPSVWTDRRFLLPSLPLLLVYALLGASGLAEAVASAGRGGEEAGDGGTPPARRRGRAGAVAAGLVALALGAAGVRSLAERAPERVRCLQSYRSGDPCLAPQQASFHEAARWARENTPEDAVIVNRKPRIFYWISRRRGDLYPYSSDPDVVLSGIEETGADYVVIDRISGTTARYLVPAVEAHRNRFEVLYAEGRPTTWILRFTPPPGAALRDDAAPRGGRGGGAAAPRAAAPAGR